MDAGACSRSRVYIPPLHTSRNPTSRLISCDRFIPDRSAIDFDFAHYLLTESIKEEDNTSVVAPATEYQKLLAKTLLNNQTRILAFKSKPPAPTEGIFAGYSDSSCTKSPKPRRYISQSADRILCVPGILDDYYLNLLDWGSRNLLLLAVGNIVYLWNASVGSASALLTVKDDMGPVTSVSWASDGQRIAIGLNNSDILLWDSNNDCLLRTLRGVHQSRVGSLAWNNNILTTGGMDGNIVDNDVRIRFTSSIPTEATSWRSAD